MKKARLEDLNFLVPSMEKIDSMTASLAKTINFRGKSFDIVVGVLRGGEEPSKKMAQILKLQRATIRVRFYKNVDETEDKPEIIQPLSSSVKGKRVLLVDDVADRGATLLFVLDFLTEQGAKEVTIVTLFYKPWSKIIPHFFGEQTTLWIIFPWPHELEETIEDIYNDYGEEGLQKIEDVGVDAILINRFRQKIKNKGGEKKPENSR